MNGHDRSAASRRELVVSANSQTETPQPTHSRIGGNGSGHSQTPSGTGRTRPRAGRVQSRSRRASISSPHLFRRLRRRRNACRPQVGRRTLCVIRIGGRCDVRAASARKRWWDHRDTFSAVNTRKTTPPTSSATPQTNTVIAFAVFQPRSLTIMKYWAMHGTKSVIVTRLTTV